MLHQHPSMIQNADQRGLSYLIGQLDVLLIFRFFLQVFHALQSNLAELAIVHALAGEHVAHLPGASVVVDLRVGGRFGFAFRRTRITFLAEERLSSIVSNRFRRGKIRVGSTLRAGWTLRAVWTLRILIDRFVQAVVQRQTGSCRSVHPHHHVQTVGLVHKALLDFGAYLGVDQVFVQKANLPFGRVQIDVQVLLQDREAQVDERIAAFHQLVGEDLLDRGLQRGTVDQTIVDEQNEQIAVEGCVRVADQAVEPVLVLVVAMAQLQQIGRRLTTENLENQLLFRFVGRGQHVRPAVLLQMKRTEIAVDRIALNHLDDLRVLFVEGGLQVDSALFEVVEQVADRDHRAVVRRDVRAAQHLAVLVGRLRAE